MRCSARLTNHLPNRARRAPKAWPNPPPALRNRVQPFAFFQVMLTAGRRFVITYRLIHLGESRASRLGAGLSGLWLAVARETSASATTTAVVTPAQPDCRPAPRANSGSMTRPILCTGAAISTGVVQRQRHRAEGQGVSSPDPCLPVGSARWHSGLRQVSRRAAQRRRGLPPARAVRPQPTPAERDRRRILRSGPPVQARVY
jgi:hypothetical protein